MTTEQLTYEEGYRHGYEKAARQLMHQFYPLLVRERQLRVERFLREVKRWADFSTHTKPVFYLD